ncbi:hypothetical protein [Streptomyces sp. NPDC094149]
MIDEASVRELAREHGVTEPMAGELTRRLRPCVGRYDLPEYDQQC